MRVFTLQLQKELRELWRTRKLLIVAVVLLAFGVIVVLGPPGAGQIEVATFRSDFDYQDGRRQGRVAFSSAQEDASRRDFTINGLFYDPTCDRVIDFVGGRADLAARVVRAIGRPDDRFNEDKLRMLRAVRFAATLGFALDPATREAVTWDGRVWAMPMETDVRVLYYNKGQFAEAGLDPETPPETWDDLWEFALKVDQIDASGSLQRVGFSPMFGNVYVFPFLFANGAVPVSDAGEFNFQSPEIIETAYWYKQWADHYGHEELLMFASGFGTEANDPFMSGLLSMIVQNNRYIGDLIKYAPATEWGVGMIPHTGTPASQGAGYDLEVPKGASNPDGAWDLIKAGMSREVQVGGAKLAGWLPSVMANAEDPSLADIPFWDVVVASAKVTQGRKFVLEAPSWFAFVVTAFEEVWDGLKTPEQALADAQAAAEKEVENYHAARQ